MTTAPDDVTALARAVDAATAPADLEVLDEVQRRVLWLATRIVDAANHDRDTGDGVKVGGHQASSASLVTVMTALWFAHLDGPDRVAVKPHASPVFHAIQYLLGNLDRSYLTRLRERGGLQSYPSRTKDPDEVDFSTGSVGLGAAAPLFAAAVRRYVDAHFGPRPRSRFIALLGDAELDEGNVWEAVADPATAGLGEVMWVVDLNRQSLDRVVPGVRVAQWRGQFEAAGWHVVEVKYGRRLAEAYTRPGGEHLRAWIDAMPNEQYQSLFGPEPAVVRERFLDGAPPEVATFVAGIPDAELAPLVTDLGGHDLAALLDAFAQCDAVTDRPSVVLAYTVKGWGLPIAGNPRNHAALLSTEQVDALRTEHGLSRETEWDRLEPSSAAGVLAAARREALARSPRTPSSGVTVPTATGARSGKPVSTQEVFGRVLVELSRDEAVAPLLVTTAPDVATSTNLAGFINRTGVFAPAERRSWSEDRMLRWTETPTGQHIELGISEMNLFLLLEQLGLAWDLSGQPLLAVGTVYDPFVLRGLDAFVHAVYSGARFVVAGTPSGITLAPEGGAHQSTITASPGARRRVPARRRARGPPAAQDRQRPGRAPRSVGSGHAGGAGGRGGARRRGGCCARRRRHVPGPAVHGVAADAAAGRADRDGAERRRRAADRLPGPRTGGHRARRRLARHGLARVGARCARRAARRRRVRAIGVGARPVRAARPAARLDRQRCPRSPHPRLTSLQPRTYVHPCPAALARAWRDPRAGRGNVPTVP